MIITTSAQPRIKIATNYTNLLYFGKKNKLKQRPIGRDT